MWFKFKNNHQTRLFNSLSTVAMICLLTGNSKSWKYIKCGGICTFMGVSSGLLVYWLTRNSESITKSNNTLVSTPTPTPTPTYYVPVAPSASVSSIPSVTTKTTKTITTLKPKIERNAIDEYFKNDCQRRDFCELSWEDRKKIRNMSWRERRERKKKARKHMH